MPVPEVGTALKRHIRGVTNQPGVRRFVYTGESLNPWRCELCYRKSSKVTVDTLPSVNPPYCCNKCGLEFI
jgi:hypothetical protein